MAINRFTSLMIALALTSCATSPNSIETKEAIPSQEAADRLTPRQLEKGACGTFVWTADATGKFILFSQGDKPTADWMSPEGEVKITRYYADGEESFGQYAIQKFNMRDDKRLDLELRNSETIIDGVRYNSGIIRYTNAEGWETLTPVVGIASCYNPL